MNKYAKLILCSIAVLATGLYAQPATQPESPPATEKPRSLEEYKFPADPPKSIPEFTKEVADFLAAMESRGFSGVVLIAHQGSLILHKAYGMADREAGRKMTT